MTFISYAQNFEDIMLWRALKHVENGFYIDVGANDPLVDSVTHAFYERGWHGINVEPSQQHYRQLRIKRPADINLKVAIADTVGELTFYDVPDTGLSTADAAIAEAHVAAGHTVNRQTVAVTTLAEICRQHVAGPIHFLKIDVEGLEKPALLAMDFQRWRPWILVIEATKPQTQLTNHEEWQDLVLSAGYRFAYFDGLNHFYVAEEQADLFKAFNAPPNFFDHFQLREDHTFSYPTGFLREKIRQAEVKADDAEQRAQQALTQLQQIHGQIEAQLRQSDARLHDIQKANTRLQQEHQQLMLAQQQAHQHAVHAAAQLALAHQHIEAITSSFSWRITRPLRQVKTVARNPRLLITKSRSLLSRLKALTLRLIVRLLKWMATQYHLRRLATHVLARFPGLKDKIKSLGAQVHAQSAAPPVAPGQSVQAPEHLPAAARKVYIELHQSINKGP